MDGVGHVDVPQLPSIWQLEDLLNRRSVGAALEYLSQFLPHRFTVFSVLRGMEFEAEYLIDKEGVLCASDMAPSGFFGSYCELAMINGSLVITDSLKDPRVQKSRYRDLYRSYVGMPMRTGNNKMFGIICFADLVPQPGPDCTQYQFFRTAASMIASAADPGREHMYLA